VFPAGVCVKHGPRCLLAAHLEDILKDVDDELHGREVVVEEDDLIARGFLGGSGHSGDLVSLKSLQMGGDGAARKVIDASATASAGPPAPQPSQPHYRVLFGAVGPDRVRDDRCNTRFRSMHRSFGWDW
jgi:hypothetical protein